MNRRTWIHIAACLACCHLAQLAAADETEYAAAKLLVKEASSLIGERKFSQASEVLAQLQCEKESDCYTLRLFTQGYLYETWSEHDSAQRQLLLKRAVRAYLAARSSSPANTRVLTNLSLAARKAGEITLAAKTASELVSADPDNAYEHSLYLGDLLLLDDRPDAAREAYASAIEMRDSHPAAHERMMNLYISGRDAEATLAYSRSIASRFPGTALRGLLFCINTDYRPNPRRAEQALILWVTLRSDQGGIGSTDLQVLPSMENWPSSALRELHTATVDASGLGADSFNWWRSDDLRRDAASRFLRGRAALLLTKSDFTRKLDGSSASREALALQSQALTALDLAVKTAPHFSAYLDGPLLQSSNAQLDAAADLVALHLAIQEQGDIEKFPGLEPEQLKEMTRALFGGKSRAYAAGQVEAIQRYHTVLGMLYYQTGRLQSDWADNATFQLDRALHTARIIASEDPSRYKPLPELERMLADTYSRRGDKQKSAEHSLRAAMGFLETDNLDASADALLLAQEGGADRARASAVATILGSRTALQNETVVASQVDNQAVQLSNDFAWLAQPGELPLDDNFVARQRFKTLSDLGGKLQQAGYPNASMDVKTRAFDIVQAQASLTSVQDVRRLQQLELAVPPPPAVGNTPPATEIGGTWSLPLNKGALILQSRPDAQGLRQSELMIKRDPQLPDADARIRR